VTRNSKIRDEQGSLRNRAAIGSHSHGSGARMGIRLFRSRGNFALPLAPACVLGGLVAALFYGLLIYGPLNYDVLKRYCLSHPVAVASVSLFFVALVGLTAKWFSALAQLKDTASTSAALERLLVEGESVVPAERPVWLDAQWYALPNSQQHSWLGRRISELVQRQIKRGKRSYLENDIRDLAEADADAQHNSYSLIRIITWAMPMLGFLGTVLGISKTLGQLDVQLLSSQSQDAMNQLTAGLYVAFDTTAIALVLTVVAMFIQFAVSGLETSLLSQMDRTVQDNLIEFLGTDPHDAEKGLLGPVREMASELVGAVRELVQQQVQLWSHSIGESQQQWAQWTETGAEQLRVAISESLDRSLSSHAAQIDKAQQEATRQIESRWQQWQCTLSDQARIVHSQQKELVRQTEAIERLVGTTTELRKLEEVVRESFSNFDHIERLRQASLGIGEAVAVLATSLERAGLIRGAPVKPRATRSSAAEDPAGPSQSESRRKAA
jgi:biopolymer transport protein ExbB/TolQ